MAGTKDRMEKVGVFLASGIFRTTLYICLVLLILWLGKSSYEFGYNVFNQEAMSPGDGQEVTVVIQEGSSVWQIGRTLKQKGLIEDAKVFWVQELLSSYHGKLESGTYLLSTAYTPNRIMSILAGEDEEGTTDS
ncbi:MAG: solute-binding protein [Clostridiales bacterium]|nr:solute-binding protein [Clostridiales bacterium]